MVYVLLALSAVFSAAVSAACNWFAGWAVLWQLPLLFIGCFLGLVLLFLLVLVVSCLFVDPKKLVEKPSPYFRFLLNQFSRLAFDLGGVRVHVTGLEKVPRKGRFLLISNHLFAFDPIVFYYAMPWAELAFISKTENFSLYIVAQVMRKILCLPLDRNNDREALKVDRTRIISIVMSTVFAGFGMILYLQNMGNLSTYSSHSQIGMFCIAALLVGGASVDRASIGNVFLGVTLFHLMFIVAPAAGAKITGDSMIGEYFRVFISYGVITVALIMYETKKRRNKSMAGQELAAAQKEEEAK